MDDSTPKTNYKNADEDIEFVVILFLSFVIIVCCNKFVFNEC